MTPRQRIRRIQRWSESNDRGILLACFLHNNPWRREDGAKHERFRSRCTRADTLMRAELMWLCEFAMPTERHCGNCKWELKTIGSRPCFIGSRPCVMCSKYSNWEASLP